MKTWLSGARRSWPTACSWCPLHLFPPCYSDHLPPWGTLRDETAVNTGNNSQQTQVGVTVFLLTRIGGSDSILEACEAAQQVPPITEAQTTWHSTGWIQLWIQLWNQGRYLELIGLLDDHLQLGVLAQDGTAHLRHVLWSHRCLVVVAVSCGHSGHFHPPALSPLKWICWLWKPAVCSCSVGQQWNCQGVFAPFSTVEGQQIFH